MKQSTVLEDKEVQKIIAEYLGIDVKRISRLKYSYAIEDATCAEIKKIEELDV